MRTRERVNPLGIFYLAFAIANVARWCPKFQHHSAEANLFDLFPLICWSTLGVIWVPFLAFNSWRVDAKSVSHRILWKSRDIPMSRIVAIRPRESSKPVARGPLEIEVSKFGPNVYPHDYIIANPVDREGFLQAVRTYAPQISIEA